MPAPKLFISHASEDKSQFVEPLVKALNFNGFEVWYDKSELTMGDSLLQKISQGLQECDYGVVVLSPDFFRKKWPRAELDGMFAIESTERKMILPIWKDVTVEDVTRFSPILAGRLGVSTTEGIEYVVAQIRRAVEAADRVASFSSIENAVSRFRSLDQEIGGRRRAAELAGSAEGVCIVVDVANQLLAFVRNEVERIARTSENLEIRVVSVSDAAFSFNAAYGFQCSLIYTNPVSNSIEHAALNLRVWKSIYLPISNQHEHRKFLAVDFVPNFHHTGILKWRGSRRDEEFTTEQLRKIILDDIFDAFSALHRKAK